MALDSGPETLAQPKETGLRSRLKDGFRNFFIYTEIIRAKRTIKQLNDYLTSERGIKPDSMIPTLHESLGTIQSQIKRKNNEILRLHLGCQAVVTVIASALAQMNEVLPNLPGTHFEQKSAAFLAPIIIFLAYNQFEKHVIRTSIQKVSREVSLINNKIRQEVVPANRVNPKYAKEIWEDFYLTKRR